MVDDYAYQRRVRELWQKAVELYAAGNRDLDTYFAEDERDFIGSIGAAPIDFFDFAEDFQDSGEPDWETFLLIQAIRREYFTEIQKGIASPVRLDEAELPEREAEAAGLAWLPRLIVKARAKLRGELPQSIMYCCGGDRNFFRTHDIHPADFLQATWKHEGDEAALIDWTVKKSSAGR